MTPKQITKLQEYTGLSKVDFAETLGVTRACVWNWMRGRTPPNEVSTEKLWTLARATRYVVKGKTRTVAMDLEEMGR